MRKLFTDLDILFWLFLTKPNLYLSSYFSSISQKLHTSLFNNDLVLATPINIADFDVHVLKSKSSKARRVIQEERAFCSRDIAFSRVLMIIRQEFILSKLLKKCKSVL